MLHGGLGPQLPVSPLDVRPMQHSLVPDDSNSYNHLLLSTYYVPGTMVEAMYTIPFSPPNRPALYVLLLLFYR